jgi:hypothetical protein
MAAQLTSFVSGTPNVSSLMVKFTPVASSANYVNITNAIVNNAPIVAANGSDANVDLSLAGKGSGAVNSLSSVVITPGVQTGGAATTGALEVIGAANTAVLTGTEASDVIFDLARTVTWAAGNITEQRAVNIQAPTYTAVGATVIDDAATVAIAGAPIPSAPLTITRTHALWVQSGMARFDGAVVAGSTLDVDGVVTLNSGIDIDATVANPTITSTRAGENLRLRTTTTGAVSLQGSGGASIVAVDNGGGASAARLGFFNVGPVERQATPAANAAAIISLLQTYGLCL